MRVSDADAGDTTISVTLAMSNFTISGNEMGFKANGISCSINIAGVFAVNHDNLQSDAPKYSTGAIAGFTTDDKVLIFTGGGIENVQAPIYKDVFYSEAAPDGSVAQCTLWPG